jgi:hypothetical protein
MPRLRISRFSDLGFLQSVDQPRFLRPLLTPYASYFKRQGLNLRELGNGDDDDRKLVAIFTRPDEEMPPALLDLLYVLDDLADDNGHDRILEEAKRQDVSLDGIVGRRLSAGEFAIAVFLTHPKVVRTSHEKTLYTKMRNFEEFRAQEDRRLTLASAKRKRPTLERELGLWFEKNDRSPVCEIYAYEEDEEIRFEITHGRPYRTDGTIDKSLRRSRIAYRPQKHDSAIYDPKTLILKVSAQTRAEKEEYRRAIGEVLFGDPDHFPASRVYTLAPLRRKNPRLALVTGIDSVRLAEVWIQHPTDEELLETWRGRDLLETAKGTGRPNLSVGTIVRAAFFCRFEEGGRPRKVEVRPPNIAVYDRARGGALMERFLTTNGIQTRSKE